MNDKLIKLLNPIIINSEKELEELIKKENIEIYSDRATAKIKEIAGVLYKKGYRFYYLKLKLNDKEIKMMKQLDCFELVTGEENIYTWGNINTGSIFYIELED